MQELAGWAESGQHHARNCLLQAPRACGKPLNSCEPKLQQAGVQHAQAPFDNIQVAADPSQMAASSEAWKQTLE